MVSNPKDFEFYLMQSVDSCFRFRLHRAGSLVEWRAPGCRACPSHALVCGVILRSFINYDGYSNYSARQPIIVLHVQNAFYPLF